MKKLTLLSTFCFLLLTLLVKAQTPPNAFNYSAVARNAAGQPIATVTIGIQITILKTSPTGVSQYSENHFVNTDAFGLFNLIIGAGAIQSGSMATIDWSNDIYYMKVGMDASGGTNFLTMGTTQLLSVPYALHSKTADSITGGTFSGNYNDLVNTPVNVSNFNNDAGYINNESQQLSVSLLGDTLFLQNGGHVIIPGISAANTPASIFAGTWNGTYIGDDNGTFQFYIDNNGNMTGDFYSNINGGPSPGTGIVDQNGSFSGTTSTGTNVQGTMSVSGTSGTANGTWNNPILGTTGTLSATRVP
ncbi:MAG: hypothetical protein ACK5JQ_06510 [Bacteroidota bacterium]|jgi:hypothetical protein